MSWLNKLCRLQLIRDSGLTHELFYIVLWARPQHGRVYSFFFFLIFIQFVTILLLFYVLFFWLEALWDLSFWTRGRTGIPCIEGQSLNHGTVREFPSMGFVRDEILAW